MAQLAGCYHAGMPKSEFVFRYRVRNWPEYNRALIRRGQLTLWFDEAGFAAWRQTEHTGRRGRPCVYANTMTECALVLKSVFHLSLRVTQGFLESITAMRKLELPVPDYSTVSRRQAGLSCSLRLVDQKPGTSLALPSECAEDSDSYTGSGATRDKGS